MPLECGLADVFEWRHSPAAGDIMLVLLTGATGFIGRHLLEALAARGHEVVSAGRRASFASAGPTGMRQVYADFTSDFDPAVWIPRLDGVHAVINAVGILRERGNQTFDAIHVRAPQALFAACASAGVRRVIQISALGADAEATSRYHLSKKNADDFLAQLPLNWTIAQPSLVYGPGGTSARLFTTLASLPIIPVPGRGEQQVQPLHIDDLTQAVVGLLESNEEARSRVSLVGPAPLSLREFLARLRNAMGFGRGWFLPMPMSVMRFTARLGAMLPGALLDTETLTMLERGNTADPAATRRLLHREPRAIEAFVPARDAAAVGTVAKLQWLSPVLRSSIALVWIVTGIVSLGLYPVAESYALLARVGVSAALAPVFLYAAAFLDLFFGFAALLMRRRRWLWLAQIAVVVGYTLIITVKLPEFWLHPYGPILKNLPFLAALWLLYELEPRRWNT
jgi:uncharacterized protein YbjT (DUF2867 family)